MSDRAGVDTGGFGGGSRSTFGKGCAVAAGIGCIVLIALLATCVGGGAFMFNRSAKSATSEIEPFLTDLSEGRYEAAYERVAPSWQDSTTLDEFREQFTAFQQELGRFESLSVRGLKIEGGTNAFREVTYEATYEYGSARIRVRLEKDEDGIERIAGVRTESRSRGLPEVPAPLDDDPTPEVAPESETDPAGQ
jgi:hypothetical protein